MIAISYDQSGNVATITPPGRPNHAFTYTPVDLESEYLPPDVGFPPATRYSYNLDKQLTKITRPDGQAIDLNYDTAGKLISITPSPLGGGGLGGGILYAYSPATGQLETITTPDGGTLNYTWDGALLTGTTWIGPITGSVTRTFDSDFRTASLTVNGDTVNLAYDPDSLLTQAGSLALTRDSQNGLVTGTVLGSVTTSQVYSTFGEVSQFTASYGGSALLEVQYTRDNLGRVTGKTETVQGETATYSYGYDQAGRLTEVRKDGATVSQYTYDSNSNRVGAQFTAPLSSVTGTYDQQDRLLQYGATTYTHTANGELQSRTDTATNKTTVFEYDLLGNLSSVVLPDNTLIEHLIDGRNRRIGRKVDGVLTQGFLYQDQLKPVAELDGTGSVTARFVYGTKPNVPEYMVKGGATYRIVTDHLGSPRLVIDTATGNIAQRIDYDEFGSVTMDTNPGFQPFGYAGGLYDPQTKLVRFGARDYDPETGRWTAKDPIGFAGGDVNLYGYVLNDPVNLIDPMGRDIIINNTGVPIVVSGNPGPGHGSGDPQYGVVPPDGKPYGGKDNPIPSWKDKKEAQRRAEGGSCPLPDGEIRDVDNYYDPKTGEEKRVHGDDEGPITTLGVGKDGKVTESKLGVWRSRWRYIWR